MVNVGAVCASFMKGKWNAPPEPTDRDILFGLNDAHTLVHHEKDYVMVGDLVIVVILRTWHSPHIYEKCKC